MRIDTRIAVVVALALLAAASLTSSAGARRQAPNGPDSAVARACSDAGSSYDNHAWRAPEEAFGGFSCTFVTFAGPTALSSFAPALRGAISDACSRKSGSLVSIATFTYVGYGCIWPR